MPTPRPPVGGSEKVQAEGGSGSDRQPVGLPPSLSAIKEHVMAFVRVEQRNAHLAAAVRLEIVQRQRGQVAKGTLTAISNTRRAAARRARRRRPRSSGPCGASRPRTRPSTWARAATSTSSAGCRTTTTRSDGREGLRPGLHVRGDRLPRQPGRCRGAPGQQEGADAAAPSAAGAGQRGRSSGRSARQPARTREGQPGRATRRPF